MWGVGLLYVILYRGLICESVGPTCCLGVIRQMFGVMNSTPPSFLVAQSQA